MLRSVQYGTHTRPRQLTEGLQTLRTATWESTSACSASMAAVQRAESTSAPPVKPRTRRAADDPRCSARIHAERSQHVLAVNIKRTPKPQPVRSSEEPPLKKLAIYEELSLIHI